MGKKFAKADVSISELAGLYRKSFEIKDMKMANVAEAAAFHVADAEAALAKAAVLTAFVEDSAV
jgi:hypothetical protein